MSSRLWVLVLALSIFVGCAPTMLAQSASTGSVAGVVTDSSGAVIPNATVTLANNGTGQTQKTLTNGDGVYRFSLLSPGTYTLQLTAPGFETFTSLAVLVNITEVTVLNPKLVVGATSQQVTVTAAPPLLETVSSGQGSLIQSKTLTALPLTTRNFTQILDLSPGVAAPVNDAATLGRGSEDLDVNGQATNANNFEINGADANQWYKDSDTEIDGPQGGGITIPNPDAIAEFKVQTAQYDAEYGRNPGGNVDVVTKSGSDKWHGSAFEFFRNTVLDANDYFMKAAGDPRGVMQQNQFGGAIGGPIVKDKLLFFVSEQETGQKNGLYHSTIGDAYTSAILPPLTNTNRNAAALGAMYCQQPTYAGGVQVACNGSNINPVALALLNYKLSNGTYLFPTPQTTLASGQGFSAFSIPALFSEHQIVLDTDYIASSKNTLSEKWVYSYDPEFVPFLSPANVPAFPSHELFVNNDVSLTLTTVLSASAVNALEAAYDRIHSSGFLEGTPPASTFGMAAFNPISYPEIPMMVVGANSYGSGETSDTNSVTDHILIEDGLSWTRGNHALRLGGGWEWIDNRVFILGRSRGVVYWQTFQDFLLGMSAAQNGSPKDLSNINEDYESMWTENNIGKDMLAHNQYADMYIQDDWKVTPRLTLNLGTRWEYMGEGYDPSGDSLSVEIPTLMATVPVPPPGGTYVGFAVPADYNPKQFGPPPAGVLTLPKDSPYLNGTPLYDYAPRIGFAWQPGRNQSDFVVRGGYGWFYQLLDYVSTDGHGIGTEPFAFSETVSGAAVGTSTDQNPPQYPGGLPPLGWHPRTLTSSLTNTIGGIPMKFVNPMTQEYSLDIQYAHGTWRLDVGTVGNHSSNQQLTEYPNQPALASASNPVNCGYDGAIGDCITTNTIANAPDRLPIMGFQAGGTVAPYTGKLWYNSLQLGLTKRASRGLTVEAAYTWSKNLQQAIYNDATVIQEDPTAYNRAQRLIVNYQYELPALGASRAFVKTMLSGWTTSGVATAQTGLPLALIDNSAGSIYDHNSPSTVTLCPAMTARDLKNTKGNDVARLNNWFNTAAICSAPVIGNGTGFGNTSEDNVSGPGQLNFDMAVGKTTPVGGINAEGQLQFRAEFYNAFNHPQFDVPGTTLATSAFGVITDTVVAPRLIQFSMKYVF